MTYKDYDMSELQKLIKSFGMVSVSFELFDFFFDGRWI